MFKWFCDRYCECEPEIIEVPVPCKGAPRTQFKKVFQLVHDSVGNTSALRIFQNGRALNRTTGFSADEAGLGDLDVRIVNAFGWPDFQALINFFADYYPGVIVNSMPVPIPGYELAVDVSAAGQGIVSRESFRKMRERGIAGVYIRGPRGDNDVDINIQHNFINATSQGLKVGMYGIWFPNENAQAQAQKFANVYNSYVWNYPPACDFELGADDYATEVETFLGYVSSLTEVTPNVYTGKWWWNPNIGDTVWAKNYPLWVASHYDQSKTWWRYPEEFSNTNLPAGWSEWSMWQFGLLPGSWFDVNSEHVDINWIKNDGI